jgi:hypothetical protein
MSFEKEEPYEFMIDKLDENVHSRYTRKIFDYLRKIEVNKKKNNYNKIKPIRIFKHYQKKNFILKKKRIY